MDSIVYIIGIVILFSILAFYCGFKKNRTYAATAIIIFIIILIFFLPSTFFIQLLRANIFAIGFTIAAAIFVSKEEVFPKKKGSWWREKCSQPTLKKITIGAKIIMLSAIAGFFIVLSIPLLKDDYLIFRKGLSLNNFLVKEGIVERNNRALLGLWFIHQSICFSEKECFENKEYCLYLNPYVIYTHHNYKVYYLPNSKLIMKIEEMG